MEKIEANTIELRVQPDPEVLKKYHPASDGAWMAKSRIKGTKELAKSIEIIQVYVSDKLAAGYDIENLVNTNHIGEYHAKNILSLVYSMVTLELAEYRSHTDENGTDYYLLIKEILNELFTLTLILENIDEPDSLPMVVINKNNKPIKGARIGISKDIIKSLAEVRITQLKPSMEKIPVESFSFAVDDLFTLNSDEIKSVLLSMERLYSNKKSLAEKEFNRLLLATINKYLIEQVHKDTLTDELCVFMHCILAIFKLIPIDDVLKFENEDGKRKIATLIRNQLRDHKGKFELHPKGEFTPVKKFLKSLKK